MSQGETDDAGDKTNGTTKSDPPRAAQADVEARPETEPDATESVKGRQEGELASIEGSEGGAAASSGPSPLEAAKAEAAKYRDQLLRTAADFDNFRKRTRRELEDAQKKGTEKALKEMLPVFDNLERALQSAETAPDAKSVADGLRLVGRQFASTLDKLSIKRVPTVGLPFDPMRHEAISHVESNEHPAGVIATEVQAGYMLGDFLLRAALVAVSAGPGPGGQGETTEAEPTGES